METEGTPDPTVGLVGEDRRVDRAVRAAVTSTVAGDATTVVDASPDVVVAVGEGPILALARRRPAAPILPVDAGAGLRSVPPTAVTAALSRYGSDDWEVSDHPLLSVSVEGDPVGTALFDACLVSAAPARISEFSVTADGESVARLRADGLLAATPAGTNGYARAVGTPTIPPGPNVLAVAPVAPFATDPTSWILPDDGMTVAVERDETPVTVLADDRSVSSAEAGESVGIARDGTVQTVVVPESPSPFDREDAELEKH